MNQPNIQKLIFTFSSDEIKNNYFYKLLKKCFFMITYQDLYEYLRKEKYSETLQQLPNDFISQVSAFLQEQQTQSNSEEASFLEGIGKNKKQFENSVSLFKELMLRRKKKLLNLVFVATETGIMKRDYENMLSIERDVFDKMVKIFEEADKELSRKLYQEGSHLGGENRMVIFSQDTEQFVDLDGKVIGPFKAGELVYLDKKVAEILVTSGKARIVDASD